MVTCADGYIAARDTETTLTCIFDSELRSLLLEGSAHPCELSPCDLSTLMPSSTVSHDCPSAVFGESCTESCFDGDAAISGTAAFIALAGGSEGALVSDLTFPYPSCRGASIVDTCMVFCAERYQAVSNNTSILTCSCNSRDNTDWEGEVSFRLVITGDVFASSRVDFSECSSLTDRETSVVRYSVSDTGAGDKNPTPMGRSFDNTKLDPSDRLALTQRTVKRFAMFNMGKDESPPQPQKISSPDRRRTLQ